jgi:hypothetical protein
MTQTLPVPPPQKNPSPRELFLSSAQNIDEHHRMIESAAFQRAIQAAQAHYVRAMCATAPPEIGTEEYQRASSTVFNRIQGMNDFVSLLLQLAELPQPPSEKKQRTDNLS